jgi:hypothetical protein
MPAKNTTTPSLRVRLLEGFDVRSRADDSVHTVKANGRVIAEVCEGKKQTRLNLRELPAKVKPAKNVTLGGKSKSWPGGGTVVTDANLTAARALLTAVAKATPTAKAPTASDAAKQSATATADRTTARKALTRVGRSSTPRKAATAA